MEAINYTMIQLICVIWLIKTLSISVQFDFWIE